MFSPTRSAALRRVLLAAASISMLVAAQPAAAVGAKPVNFTVHETLPTLGVGRIVRGQLADCPNPAVHTTSSGGSGHGGQMVFNGSKRFDCGGGNSLTLAFRVTTGKCQKTDAGVWKVVRGRGVFASAKGSGRLVGTYMLGNKPGTQCNADGLDDHVGITRVVHPAGLIDHVEEVAVIEDERVRVVAALAGAPHDALDVADDGALLSTPRRDDAIAGDWRTDDLEPGNACHATARSLTGLRTLRRSHVEPPRHR